jgi:OHCU decarboxylase
LTTLERLNSLPPNQAELELRKCCGSKAWATQVTAARPFSSLDELRETADRVWQALKPSDWLQAFHSHPKIGEQKAAQATAPEASAWSEQEQAGTHTAAEETKEELARGNREYEQKFGFIFIICATGKNSEEMLASLQERLKNDRQAELHNAAAEQGRITKLRLGKLINDPESGIL